MKKKLLEEVIQIKEVLKKQLPAINVLKLKQVINSSMLFDQWVIGRISGSLVESHKPLYLNFKIGLIIFFVHINIEILFFVSGKIVQIVQDRANSLQTR